MIGQGVYLRSVIDHYLMAAQMQRQEANIVKARAFALTSDRMLECLLPGYSETMLQILDAPPAFPVPEENIPAYSTFRCYSDHVSYNIIKSYVVSLKIL
jgi:hypothetical protein